MLLFSLFFFLSFSCLLWVAFFKYACRDLPPSRALAIAQGRLDPISMCTFDELACKEPCLPQHTLKEAKSTCRNSRDGPSSHKGDVWLGTDEELFRSLAASKPELLLSPLHTSASTWSLNVRPNNGFIAHLTSIPNIKAVVPSLEQVDPACNSPIVVLSPGKKRVLPPPLNNNPFKRGKRLDESFSLSSKARFLFDNELDGKLLCRGDQCVEKAICVPHQASHEAGQFRCIKHGSQRSIVTGDSVGIKAGGNPSLMFMKVGNSQDPLHSESTTLAPLHVQDSEESIRDIDSSSGGTQVLIEGERAGDTQVLMQSKIKTLPSLQADFSGIKPVMGLHIYNSKASMHPEPQASMSPVYQDSVVQQYSSEVCAVLTSHSFIKARTDSPKIPAVTKKLQREAKTKKEIRSSSKQSVKLVMAASTPSLLKFFQRAPTR